MYGCEADIWSLGVICYILLCGYPPFYDEDERELFRNIKGGRYTFHDEAWEAVSVEAIGMIKNMLCVNQKKRWTAQRLLSHPWIIDEQVHLEQKSLNHSIITMKKLLARRRFKGAINTVIFTNRLSHLYGTGTNAVSNSYNTTHAVVDTTTAATSLTPTTTTTTNGHNSASMAITDFESPSQPYVSSDILTSDILYNDGKKQQLLQQLLHQQSQQHIPYIQVNRRSSIYMHEQHNTRLTLTRRDLKVINNDDDKHSYRRNEYYI